MFCNFDPARVHINLMFPQFYDIWHIHLSVAIHQWSFEYLVFCQKY
jgi:hypothetical protein